MAPINVRYVPGYSPSRRHIESQEDPGDEFASLEIFCHVILLCARVFSRDAAKLKVKQTPGTGLLLSVKSLISENELSL